MEMCISWGFLCNNSFKCLGFFVKLYINQYIFKVKTINNDYGFMLKEEIKS